MKQRIKLGSIKVTEFKNIRNDNGDLVETVEFNPIAVENIEIEFEISADEMLTQMKNFKEICQGTLELYKIVKGEVISGEFNELVNACKSIGRPTPDPETPAA